MRYSVVHSTMKEILSLLARKTTLAASGSADVTT
jgi:hypothetical protein